MAKKCLDGTIQTPYDWERKKLYRQLIEKKYQINLWRFLSFDCDIQDKVVTMYVNVMDWDFILYKMGLSQFEQQKIYKMKTDMFTDILHLDKLIEVNNLVEINKLI